MQNVAQARPARRMRHPLVLGGKLQTAVITTDGIEQSENIFRMIFVRRIPFRTFSTHPALFG